MSAMAKNGPLAEGREGRDGREGREGRARFANIAAALVATALVVFVHAGPQVLGLPAKRAPHATVHSDVKDLVLAGYVVDVDPRTLDYKALKGMISGLDPYSAFLTPEEARAADEETHGKFSGIGIQIALERGHLVVIAPLDGGPAFEAGMLPGDRIIEVDGKPHEFQSVEEAARVLKGPEGSWVTLTVIHEGETRAETFRIRRAVINVRSVKRPRLIDEAAGIGYVRITQFQDSTPDELDRALDALGKRGARAFVLDLRSNPGGLLKEAVEVADRLLAGGVIVRTVGRVEAANDQYVADRLPKEWSTMPGEVLGGKPLAVLVNGASASASEILAGALKDNGRGTVVGERTYGKGSVQSVKSDFADGSQVRLTTARFYTASGRPIHREPGAGLDAVYGIEPDVKVALDPQRLNLLFRRMDAQDAAERRRGGAGDNGEVGVGPYDYVGRGPNGASLAPARDEAEKFTGAALGRLGLFRAGAGAGAAGAPADPQLEAALEALRAKLSGAPPPP